MYLELWNFDENSNDGYIYICMLVNTLHDYGLIVKDATKTGYYKSVSDLEHKQSRICGYCLLMKKRRYMNNKIYYVVTHPGKIECVHTSTSVKSMPKHPI